MFCFGCASQLAYFSRYADLALIKGRLLRNFIRLLVCFYISSFAFLLFVDDNTTFLDFVKVLCLWKIPGYSEFLLSFAMLNVVILVLYRCFFVNAG